MFTFDVIIYHFIGDYKHFAMLNITYSILGNSQYTDLKWSVT